MVNDSSRIPAKQEPSSAITAVGESGGSDSIRGYLVQTLVALIKIANDDQPFSEISLEPDHENEKFDFVYRNDLGTHAVQVKSSRNKFSMPNVSKLAEKLVRVRTHQTYSLFLVGYCSAEVAKCERIGPVVVQSANLDIPGLRSQAAQLIAKFMEARELHAGTALRREEIVKYLIAELLEKSVTREPLTREAFIKLLAGFMMQAPHKEPKFDIDQISDYSIPDIVGRESEADVLNDAWSKTQNGEPGRHHVLCFVAPGGEGKTSLVATWAVGLQARKWQMCDAAFAYSFYRQGSHGQSADSSEDFLRRALEHFGDKDVANSTIDAAQKGQHLAQLVGQQRSLLILDGVEPLQYALSSPLGARLKDRGLAALLKGLATAGKGLSLCVVTTRYAIPDLTPYEAELVWQKPLPRLSTSDGVRLLDSFKLTGNRHGTIRRADGQGFWNEFEKLVEDVKGHALTLKLFGSYLRSAHRGVIGKRYSVSLEKADTATRLGPSLYGHAFRVMDAYVASFEREGETQRDTTNNRRALALLQLLGLFDRPATAACLEALWTGNVIDSLTDALVGLSNEDRNISLKSLEDAKLLTLIEDRNSGELIAIDTHALLREYFARRLRDLQPKAWEAAHQRLFEHLCKVAKKGPQPTFDDLQPLYQAIAHGCQAELQQRAYDEVYKSRIQQNATNYGTAIIGAIGSCLGAIDCFFERDSSWSRVSHGLSELDQTWMLHEAAFHLRALGQLTDVVTPAKLAMERRIGEAEKAEAEKRDEAAKNAWGDAARYTSTLSEVELLLGRMAEALPRAKEAVMRAELSGNWLHRARRRTTYADALHQTGHQAEAMKFFEEAEKIQEENQSDQPLLHSLGGFWYCDLLLADAERGAWRAQDSQQPERLRVVCQEVYKRAEQTRSWVTGFLNEGLTSLSLGRAAFYEAVLSSYNPSLLDKATTHLEEAVSNLFRAGEQRFVPLALLARAWLRSHIDQHIGSESAENDLNEAWDIAARGSMFLFQADILLYCARLFGPRIAKGEIYPWSRIDNGVTRTPMTDVNKAGNLILVHQYERRKQELEDAKEAAIHWSQTNAPLTNDGMIKMKIPNSVIYVVGEVLGQWYHSHTKLNTLFGRNGFPGDPPTGNCIQKCQEWMRRANDAPDTQPLELLGHVLVEFMNRDQHDDEKWSLGLQSISAVLAKNGLAFDINGNVTAVLPGNSVQTMATAPRPAEVIVETAQHAVPIIVIVTVNDHETHALLDTFLGKRVIPAKVTRGGVTYNELGIHGGHRIINTICEMGAGGIGASQQRASQATEHWHPRALIAVGIAFGLDESKQNIGEVLVSTQIQDYELGRLNADGTLIPRGDKPSGADVLRNRLRQTDATESRRGEGWPRVRFGLLLSGQKLVDSLDYRESLKALFTEAIGGEMEGVGLYVSASAAKVDWIVVKAICDWGHSKNHAQKDHWQQLAARNAATVLKAALEVGSLYAEEAA